MIIKSLQRATLTVALLCISGLFLFSYGQSIESGLWVMRDNITDRDKIDDCLNFAASNDINDIFIQIRGRGDAFYKSKFLKMNPLIRESGFDPLEYVILEAHKKGLKVHAWFNTYILYSNPGKLPPDEHIINLFPEWTEVDKDGAYDLDLQYNSRLKKNFEGAYLSPLHPRVNQYLFILVREIMENYDIDGIHFDYIRFQNINYGFNKVGREEFKNITGIDPKNYMTGHNSQYKQYSDKVFYELYDDYRREAINAFVKRVRQYNNTQVNPIAISAAVKSNPKIAREQYFQDWERWLEEDWLDFVVPMNYNTSKAFIRNLKLIRNSLDWSIRDKVYMGIGVWKLTPFETYEQILKSREYGFNRVVYFSYNTFRDDNNYFYYLKKYLK